MEDKVQAKAARWEDEALAQGPRLLDGGALASIGCGARSPSGRGFHHYGSEPRGFRPVIPCLEASFPLAVRTHGSH